MPNIISINPEHVENSLSGKKQFEFRKFHCRSKVDTILIVSMVSRMVSEMVPMVSMVSMVSPLPACK